MAFSGDMVRQRRKELGWTLDELVEKTGLSKSFLSEVERGKRSPSADTLLKLSRALSLPMDGMMGHSHEPYRPEQMAKIDLPHALQEYAMQVDMVYRQMVTLYWMARVINQYRTDARKTELEKWDWPRFYEAVRVFLV